MNCKKLNKSNLRLINPINTKKCKYYQIEKQKNQEYTNFKSFDYFYTTLLMFFVLKYIDIVEYCIGSLNISGS